MRIIENVIKIVRIFINIGENIAKTVEKIIRPTCKKSIECFEIFIKIIKYANMYL